MLDERISTLAQKTSQTQLKDCDEPFAIRIGGLRARLHQSGAFYIYAGVEYGNEVFQRAAIVWRNLLRAHTSIGAPRPDNIQRDLLDSFRAQLDQVVQGLIPDFNKDMRGCPPGTEPLGKLGNARDHELARHEAEIEHYVASLDAAVARGSATFGGYNFYGNVGAVMTGPGAIAHVVQNIGPEQREALLAALRDAKQTIVQAPNIPPRDQQDLLELADEAAGEVAKGSPNTRRLSMILQSLASAVQGIASGPGAYEVLRAAAAAIGVPV
jgi:hypothetical protein